MSGMQLNKEHPMKKHLDPIHPGEILLEDFIKQLEIVINVSFRLLVEFLFGFVDHFFFFAHAGVGETAELQDKISGDCQYRNNHKDLEGLLGALIEKINHNYKDCNADQQMVLKKFRDISGYLSELHI
jgi:hypothetical protein